MKFKSAFTLIELLIVVAIIAILAAIAVPNFLEAQVRSKVSRAKADMRSMATALEAYAVDNNVYPQSHAFGVPVRVAASERLVLERVSTPIAYMSSVLIRDSFSVLRRVSGSNAQGLASASPQALPGGSIERLYNPYLYHAWNESDNARITTNEKARAWLMHSVGPDSTLHNLGGVIANDYFVDGPMNLMYDPTNGTVSFGSIYRWGGNPYGKTSGFASATGLVKAIESSFK